MGPLRITAIAFVGLVATVVASLLVSCSPDEHDTEQETTGVATVVVVSLEGFVGCGIDAALLRQPLAELVADLEHPVDALVLRFDSGGGMLNRVGPLSDMIHAYFDERDIDCIAWIERAESASSIVALTVPDLWMPPDGTIGGAVGVRETGPDVWEALPPEDQEAIRFMVAASAARGGHDRDIALSIALPETQLPGEVHAGRVLTGAEAAEVGLARVAPSMEAALDSVFGADGWRIDTERSTQISNEVRRAEVVRADLVELYRRLDRSLEAAGKREPGALEAADGYLDEVLALASVDDPAVLRAVEFLGGFQRVSAAINRVEQLADPGAP